MRINRCCRAAGGLGCKMFTVRLSQSVSQCSPSEMLHIQLLSPAGISSGGNMPACWDVLVLTSWSNLWRCEKDIRCFTAVNLKVLSHLPRMDILCYKILEAAALQRAPSFVPLSLLEAGRFLLGEGVIPSDSVSSSYLGAGRAAAPAVKSEDIKTHKSWR